MFVGESTVGVQMEVQFEAVRTEVVQERQPLPQRLGESHLGMSEIDKKWQTRMLRAIQDRLND